jgi:hypothetical protein
VAKGESGVITAAVITTVGGIITALVMVYLPDWADADAGESEEPGATPGGAQPPNPSGEPEDEVRDETGNKSGEPWMYHWVHEDGSGMTLCGDEFAPGEVDLFWVAFDAADAEVSRTPFVLDRAVEADAEGRFTQVGQRVPEDLPDGTAYLRVRGEGAGGDAAWTIDELVYTPEGVVDLTATDLTLSEGNGGQTCPATWP